MKIHTPLFVIGLLVFITPLLGLPRLIEAIILAAFGVSIMILVSTIMKKPCKNAPLEKVEFEVESTPEITEEELDQEKISEDITTETTDEETAE